MPSVDPGAARPESLSNHDRFLIEKTEEAIHDGLQLDAWCRQPDSDIRVFPIQLQEPSRLPNRAEGFFGFVKINGVKLSVMGCRQEIDFGRLVRPDAPDRLREFVLGDFLKRAHWINPDGLPGGFTIEKTLFKRPDGKHDQFPPASQPGCIDWRQIGKEYAWVLLTIQINDFVVNFGPFHKRLPEALCAPANSNFMHVAENPSKEVLLEVSVGYPVIRYAPIPNFFGYGPGKFMVAVQNFSFSLNCENSVRVKMYFASAPRCQKVLDFGKYWPDPIYGGASLLHYLSLGLWKTGPFHDFLDGKMLATHCRVHLTLIEGVEKIWNDWLASLPVTPGNKKGELH